MNERCPVRSVSREAEALAHVLAAQSPVIAAMRENQQPVRRGSREPYREAAIARAVAGSWRKYLAAAHLAAERTSYITQIHHFTHLRSWSRSPLPAWPDSLFKMTFPFGPALELKTIVVRRPEHLGPRPLNKDIEETGNVFDDLPGVLSTQAASRAALPQGNGPIN
jgi:hypothetical protein